MQTLHTSHLGDGAYVGLDTSGHQIWLGANHHSNMTVALDAKAVAVLIIWLCKNAPDIAQMVGEEGLLTCGKTRYDA